MFTKEEKAREVGEEACSWTGFYTGPHRPRPRGTLCACNVFTNKLVLHAKHHN